ncbi:metal-dependent transcriptional regulator [Bombilactobacillus bombi]|uniref:metal-dependent transcriptional regulator n=1 Tax=Bombilactobacillus bombi TaxID=1303590 RepID=UPI0015E60554|nr:metal-dependent transcriptional regulator [Bombilactobacillus bombi]MBA1434221.1 metal-dependent transcriptional regulator [Bombilactobacillus bombi]
MSPSQEDYLKNIFELQHSFQKVTNKRLAEMMHVSAPSVTEMLLNLSQSGFIEHTPYNAIALTKKGRQEAERLVKKHRLWEFFLTDKLHYTTNNVHQAADSLEHCTDDKLVQALNKFLNYPQKCPHGGIIPGNGQGETDDDDLVLSEVKLQTPVKIVRIFDNREFLDYFAQLNLKLNQTVTVLKQLPFDDSLLIQTDTGETLTLSKKTTDFIFVEKAHSAQKS